MIPAHIGLANQDRRMCESSGLALQTTTRKRPEQDATRPTGPPRRLEHASTIIAGAQPALRSLTQADVVSWNQSTPWMPPSRPHYAPAIEAEIYL